MKLPDNASAPARGEGCSKAPFAIRLAAIAGGTALICLGGLRLVAADPPGAAQNAIHAKATLVDVRKIWDEAPHNAFTDLLWHRGHWWCVFREGSSHVSPDGAIRILRSEDGLSWTPAAVLRSDEGDLRDPKICVDPGGDLMMTAAMALRNPGATRHQSLAWFSKDGMNWGPPVAIGEPNLWLWRVTWQKGTAYGIGYHTVADGVIRLYASKDGRQFEPRARDLAAQGSANETALAFDPDETAFCLLRRDGNPGSGLLGRARPPYTQWTWRDLGSRIGGPALLRLPSGRLVAAVRRHDPVRTSLCWVGREGTIQEFLKLPSGGDTSYAGLVWRENLLWVSYYSSHEGKAGIYLGRVRLEGEGQGSR